LNGITVDHHGMTTAISETREVATARGSHREASTRIPHAVMRKATMSASARRPVALPSGPVTGTPRENTRCDAPILPS
jgi:hypothetical protein